MGRYGPDAHEGGWNEEDILDTLEGREAELLLQEGEMNHGITREQRAAFISQASKVLGHNGKEDYTD